jgi:Arc/MetJ-type ribon-helix-helix transcriptional regulator
MAMRADPVFSVRLDPSMAAKIDRFADELQVSRSSAMLLLLSFGLDQSRSNVVRAAVRLRQREG